MTFSSTNFQDSSSVYSYEYGFYETHIKNENTIYIVDADYDVVTGDDEPYIDKNIDSKNPSNFQIGNNDGVSISLHCPDDCKTDVYDRVTVSILPIQTKDTNIINMYDSIEPTLKNHRCVNSSNPNNCTFNVIFDTEPGRYKLVISSGIDELDTIFITPIIFKN
jgi:hypothetical protein